MKLINADTLTDWMLDELRKGALTGYAGQFDEVDGRTAANVIGLRIDNMPAADACPVVRCKDCKHGTLTKNARGETMVSCWHPQNYIESDWLLNPDFYCADGERK